MPDFTARITEILRAHQWRNHAHHRRGETVNTAPDARSLPERMREAAKTLREASARTPNMPCDPGYWSWTPTQLENTAINWETEGQANAEHEVMVFGAGAEVGRD